MFAQPPYGARDQTRSSEILVTSRPGAGIRRSDAAPPDSRCTSTKQKKSGAQAGLFLWWRCRESNPGP